MKKNGLAFRSTTRLMILLPLLAIGSAANADDDEFVDGVQKAPIVFDGDVADRQADYVVDLTSPDDPTVDGVNVLTGDQFKVYLPEGTMPANLTDFPVCALASNCGSPLGACAPGTLGCTTAVILQGRPQSPAAPFPSVEVADNVLTLTANGDYGPVAKNIHFIGKGYQNPGPGKYKITVEHVRAGTVLAKGSTRLKILPSIRPSINLFTPMQNQLLQGLDAGPVLPWTFLVWDRHGEPFMNITLKKRNMHHYQLRQGGRTVGHVRIDAPDDASGFSVSKVAESMIPTPLIGLGPGGAAPPPTQRYAFQFDAGSSPADGCYKTTFKLNKGNSWTLFVGAPTSEACADDDDDSDSDSDSDSDD